MKKQTAAGVSYIGIGALLALIIFTSGYGASLFLRHQMNQLVSQCQQDVASAKNQGDSSKDLQGSVVEFLGRLKGSILGAAACKPDSDPAYEDDSTGIGIAIKAIHDKRAQAERVFAYTKLAALILLCLSAVPLAWYFLLARIREVAGAMRGD